MMIASQVAVTARDKNRCRLSLAKLASSAGSPAAGEARRSVHLVHQFFTVLEKAMRLAASNLETLSDKRHEP